MIELDLDAVMQPELTSINRLPMRSPLQPNFTDQESDTEFRVSVDGIWRFHLAESPNLVPKGWQTLSLDDSSWRDIKVPGVWTRQDTFDLPIYSNVRMPFSHPHEPGEIPVDNPTGLYRTDFHLDENWLDRDVVLHIGGFETVALVWCNGKFVGMGKDSRLPSEFLVGGYCNVGLNQMAIMVIKWSDASWIEDQDHWRHGGLHRSLYVEARKRTRIDDLNIVADFDPETSTGHFECRAKVVGQTDGCTVRCCLKDSVGETVATIAPEKVAQFSHDGSLMEQLQTTYTYPGHEASPKAAIESIQPWSAEDPVLYSLVTELRSPGGGLIETHNTKIGFRRVEVRDRRLLINGKPIIIFGVNRHDHHPENGKTVSLQDMRDDLVSMKRHNINALRTAHYPNDHRLLELADELGLYVVDEANVECHARAKAVANDPRYQKAIVERTHRMIMRDRNHPCIIGWSLGNEAGNGPAHDAAASLARRLDPTRFVQYEGAVMDRFISFWSDPSELSQNAPDRSERNCTDIVCPMYPPIDLIVDWARWAEETKLDDRPLIMCEYSHAMGNSNGSISEYVDAFYAEPALAGGFIWEWKDHGLAETAENGNFYWAYGGHFGEEVHDGNFCCDGLVGPDGTPHPGLKEHMWAARPVKAEWVGEHRVRFENRRNFCSTGDLELTWKLLRNGHSIESGLLDCSIPPSLQEEMEIPITTKIEEDGEYHLTLDWRLKEDEAWANAGHLISWDQVTLSRSEHPDSSIFIPASLTYEGSLPNSISAGPFELALAKNGVIESVSLDGKTLIEGDIAATVWRAPTDNDGVQTMGDSVMPGRWRDWLSLGLDRLEMSEPKVCFDENESGKILILDRSWACVRGAELHHRSRWTLNGEDIQIAEQITVPDEWDDIPRVGIKFSVPQGFENLRWFGLGPDESYSDRFKAQKVGHWQSTIDEQYHPYCYPQEHGAHHDTRCFSLQNSEGTGFEIILPDRNSFSARHHHDTDLTTAQTLADLARQEKIEVHIDAAMRGVGTGACGPDALPAYQVGSGVYKFTWFLRAV